MERLLTVEQVADHLQVKPRTVYQWVHDGYIPVIKIGVLVRFSPATLTTWLKKRETRGRPVKGMEIDLN